MTAHIAISFRRGVAALTAILLLGLVAATLAVSAAFFIAENKRTRGEAVEAQLRQLLTAGAIVATNEMNSGDSNGEHEIDLPAELKTDSATLKIAIHRDLRSADVIAKFAGRELMQTLRFEQRAGKWQIADAILGGDQPPAATQPSERSTASSQRS